MSEEEHKLLEYRLRRDWVGRSFRIKNESDSDFTIVDVYVDYREDKQSMNRVVDNYGNIWFLFELKDGLFLEEVTNERRDV